jgi:hypothetical protein
MSLAREDAEVLAIAIEQGLAAPREAIDWACSLIVEEANPSAPLVDLAGAIRPHPQDVVHILREFPGDADQTRVFRRILRRFREAALARPEAWARLTRALEQMVLSHQVPEALAAQAFRFDDQRLLAEQGIFSLESVRDEFMEFLEVEGDPS